MTGANKTYAICGAIRRMVSKVLGRRTCYILSRSFLLTVLQMMQFFLFPDADEGEKMTFDRTDEVLFVDLTCLLVK